MKSIYAINQQLSPTLKRQCGASLLEGIAYLGIAAIVVLGAVSLLTSAFGSAKTNQTTEEIISLRTAVKKIYAGQQYPASTSLLNTLRAANAIPASLTVSDATTATVTNSWGGAVAVAGNATGSAFTISYATVPQDVCVGILSGATGWQSVNANSGTAVTAFPVSPANATTLCSVTAATGNSVVFTGT